MYNCSYFCEIKQYFDEPVGRVNRNDAQKWTMGNETTRYSVRYEIFFDQHSSFQNCILRWAHSEEINRIQKTCLTDPFSVVIRTLRYHLKAWLLLLRTSRISLCPVIACAHARECNCRGKEMVVRSD